MPVLELGLLQNEVDFLRQKVAHIAMRMRGLEQLQTTMDTILKNMSENN